MNHGFTIIQIAIVVIVLSLIATILGLTKSYINKVDERAYERGTAEAVARVARRDLEQAAKTRARMHELEKAREILQSQHEKIVTVIEKESRRRLHDVEAHKNQFISDVVAGRIRLLDSGSGGTERTLERSGDPAATPGTSPSVDPRAGGSELSVEASLFLLAEAARADTIVVKLTACQGIVQSDRAER